MSVNLRYPNITALSEREQLTQIKSYLHQLVEQLNYALPNLGTGKSEQTASVQGGELSYYDLRSLIVQELQRVEDLFDQLSKEFDANVKTAVDEALTEAKESGEFDGEAGKDGADGTSATHAWDGTVLTITSASGTSSADLKGEKGDMGNSGVYIGSGDMPDDCNVQIDPNGDAFTLESLDEALASFDGDVTALKEEIGNSAVLYPVEAHSVRNGYYVDEDGADVAKAGCSYYQVLADEDHQELWGKTIKIKTYMHGDMRIAYFDYEEEETLALVKANAEADIEANPQSGIYECTIAIPDASYATELCISFCENPYLEKPEISLATGTVWQEIGNLVNALHAERQAIRDQINRLEELVCQS